MGRTGETPFQSEGMANTKATRQERASLACRTMAPDEENYNTGQDRNPGIGKPGQDFPVGKV